MTMELDLQHNLLVLLLEVPHERQLCYLCDDFGPDTAACRTSTGAKGRVNSKDFSWKREVAECPRYGICTACGARELQADTRHGTENCVFECVPIEYILCVRAQVNQVKKLQGGIVCTNPCVPAIQASALDSSRASQSSEHDHHS